MRPPQRPVLLHARLGKDHFSGKHRIQRRRETGIERHLDDHFNNLFAGAADIQRRVQMHRQLRLRVAKRGKRRDVASSRLFSDSPGLL